MDLRDLKTAALKNSVLEDEESLESGKNLCL